MKQLQALLTLFACAFLPLHAASLDDLTYTTTDGEVTITDCNNAATGELVIPNTIDGKPVTSIGDGAFWACRSLTSVTFGTNSKLTSIGGSAFVECTSLTSITIPDSVTYIGESAFEGTLFYNTPTVFTEVENIKFLLSREGKRAYLFDGSQASGEIDLSTMFEGAEVSSIDASAFQDCTTLTSIIIPDGVTTIANRAFQGCTNLTSVTIGNGVTSIREYAFFRCTSLTSVTIPDGVTSIEHDSFRDCSSLTSVTIPDSVTSIGGAFSGCTSLTSITIPDGVKRIKSYTFYNCTSLTSVTIGDAVTFIEFDAFYNCTSLTSVIFLGTAPGVGTTPGAGMRAFGNVADGAIALVLNSSFGPNLGRWNGLKVITFIVELDSFYESIFGEAVMIDATPTDGDLTNYTYQWYLNDFAIPENFGGTASSYTINGTNSNNGTWKVEVTRSGVSVEVEFEYRVFNDSDGDGLSNYRESNITNTDPDLLDSDSDGLNDYAELIDNLTDPNDRDSDDDGLFDGAEVITHLTDPNNADSDADELSDGAEVLEFSTNPNDTDSDNDGLLDGAEIKTHATNPNASDTDADGLADGAEINTHLTNPSSGDTDSDGLSDSQEINNHATDPLDFDTSGDGLGDGFVVSAALDPKKNYAGLFTADAPNALGYYSSSQLQEARLAARNEVITSPAAYQLISISTYNTAVAERDARPTQSAYDAVVTERDARPTQASYNIVVAERDARPTIEEVKDARLGSVVLQPDAANQSVKIRFSIEETDDFRTWIKRGEINEITVPLEVGKRFYRFALEDE